MRETERGKGGERGERKERKLNTNIEEPQNEREKKFPMTHVVIAILIGRQPRIVVPVLVSLEEGEKKIYIIQNDKIK